MNAPAAARHSFETVLKQVCHFKVDVIAGDANAAAYRYYRHQEYQDLHNSSVSIMLREMQREVNRGRPFVSRLHVGYSTENIRLSFTQQMILIVALWLFSHGKSETLKRFA